MKEEIKEYFQNKKVLILGYGKEGKSTHEFLNKNNIDCEIFISDMRDITGEVGQKDVNIVNKDEYLKDLDKYDIIMKSPGISLKDIDAENFRDKISSQTEIGIKFYKNQIIGVTGTKGKSTTSTLIYNLMKKAGKKVLLCGNIGVPFFDELDLIDEETIIVSEFSSHQLEYVKQSPKIAIITNIYQEHLDHYKSFLHYIYAKFNIVKFQDEEDTAILDVDNVNIINAMKENSIKSKIIELSKEKNTMFHMKHDEIYKNDENLFNNDNKRNIIGEHNLFDIMIMFAVADIYNIDRKIALETVEEFKGLEHRMEYVCSINNVKFYNDSISTIPETCIAALETLKDVDTLIVGGNDRGVDYTKLIEKINEKKDLKVICINDVGKKIYESINNEKYQIDNMKEVVDKAIEITKKICVLSPAASSYGFYKNFEDRGNKYKEELLKNNNVSRET